MRSHLTHLDRAIARLLDERARLVRSLEEPEAHEAALDDLLRRASGAFPADALRDAFAAIERGCKEATR